MSNSVIAGDYCKPCFNGFKHGGFKAQYKTKTAMLEAAKKVTTILPGFNAACKELEELTNTGVFNMRARGKQK